LSAISLSIFVRTDLAESGIERRRHPAARPRRFRAEPRRPMRAPHLRWRTLNTDIADCRPRYVLRAKLSDAGTERAALSGPSSSKPAAADVGRRGDMSAVRGAAGREPPISPPVYRLANCASGPRRAADGPPPPPVKSETAGVQRRSAALLRDLLTTADADSLTAAATAPSQGAVIRTWSLQAVGQWRF